MPGDKNKIGMIGLGLMGHGIASNILQSGRALAFLEHPGNQPVDDLLGKGAKPCNSVQQLAAECAIIILCVTGSPEVEQIMFTENGLLQALQPGCVVIDCSTSMPDSTININQSVMRAGALFMDAAMTRTPKEAAEGRLNLIVGAEPELFQEQLPLLKSFAENITLAGPVGSGHRMKLLHNFVSLGFSAIVAEAAACARSSSISPDIFIEVLAKGGGAGVILDRLTPYLLEGDDSSFRFSLANAAKDLKYYVDMARKQGIESASAETIGALYSQAFEQLDNDSSVPQLVDYLNRNKE